MITVPQAMKDAVAATHAPIWRADIVSASGEILVADLAIVEGRVEKTSTATTIDLITPMPAVPGLLDQRYLPLGSRLRITWSLEAVGGGIIIADCPLSVSQLARPESLWNLQAEDRSRRLAADDPARGDWNPTGGTTAEVIEYLVRRTFPDAVFDITGPALTQVVPEETTAFADPFGIAEIGTLGLADATRASEPWAAVQALALSAGSEAFFRGHIHNQLVVRPIPVVGTPVDELAVGEGGSVTQYTLAHDGLAPNAVALSFEDTNGNVPLVMGLWVDDRPNSPVAFSRVGSHIVHKETRTAGVAPTQAEADAAARALGMRVCGLARTPSVRSVPRPWLEPGDCVAVTYAGGPTEAQMIDTVSLPLARSAIQVTTLRTSEYQIG